MQSIDSVETCVWNEQDLVSENKEVKCNNIIVDTTNY